MPTLPILYIDSPVGQNKQAVTLLDGAGVSYQLKDVSKDPDAAAALQSSAPGLVLPVLQWDSHVLREFTRKQLVEFLWARGVKLEDS